MFFGCTVLPYSKETELGSSNHEASPSASKTTRVVLLPCSRMEVSPYSYFWWCGYIWGPWVSFVLTDEFSLRVTKITSRIGVSWIHRLPFYFEPILTQWTMAILSKGSKPYNFELQDSWHYCSMWDKSGWFSWFWQFLCEGLSSFNLKGFYHWYAWSPSLCERRTSFSMGRISRKLCRFLLMFLTCFTSLSVLLLFPALITYFVWGCLNQPIC